MSCSNRLVRLAAGLLVLTLAGPPVALAQFSDAEKFIRKAKAEAGGLAEQAETLFDLTWSEPPGDPEIAALARAEFVQYGRHALALLHRRIPYIDPVHSADLTYAAIQANTGISSGVNAGYFEALEATLWHGSVEAKRLAIPPLAQRRYDPALLAVMDVAYDHPELSGLVIYAMVAYGDDRARFFLDDILRNGSAEERKLAALALARIGNRAVDALRGAVLSDESATRQAAIIAILPVTGLDDLTTLHEYVYRFPDDETEVLTQVRARAETLEMLWEKRQDLESADPTPDD